jgi:hypothetical protein
MSAEEMAERGRLEAEGDRVGEDFGLGERTGQWSRRKRSAGWGCGIVLLITVVATSVVPFLPIPGPGKLVVVAAYVAAIVLAVLLMTLARSWRERVYQFDQGVAQFTGSEAEPEVLRWADLASLSLRVVTSYESHSLMTCVLRDSAGRTITVESQYGTACDDIAATAARWLTARLAPTLIGRYDAGEHVTFGHVIVDRTGISCPGDGSSRPWSAPWRDTRSIEMLMHAHRVTIKPHSGRARQFSLDGAPNDFLAQEVIAHAARLAGVDVTVG